MLTSAFSRFLHLPTSTDPSLAPAGEDAFYVLSPVRHLGSITDLARTSRQHRDGIMQCLGARYFPSESRRIMMGRQIDPRGFRDTLMSAFGCSFALEPVHMVPPSA